MFEICGKGMMAPADIYYTQWECHATGSFALSASIVGWLVSAFSGSWLGGPTWDLEGYRRMPGTGD